MSFESWEPVHEDPRRRNGFVYDGETIGIDYNDCRTLTEGHVSWYTGSPVYPNPNIDNKHSTPNGSETGANTTAIPPPLPPKPMVLPPLPPKPMTRPPLPPKPPVPPKPPIPPKPAMPPPPPPSYASITSPPPPPSYASITSPPPRQSPPPPPPKAQPPPKKIEKYVDAELLRYLTNQVVPQPDFPFSALPPPPPAPTKVSPVYSIDPALRERIESDILDKDTNVRFSDIIGLENAKQALTEMVVLPMSNPMVFTGIRKPPKGLLMFGPPGNGKTMLAKAAASECKATFFSISASTIFSKYIGESELLMRALFTIARERAPSIVFIDEIDSILSKRGDETDNLRGAKTQFLVQFDGAGTQDDDDPKKRVVVIGATNTPQTLDDAALRRLSKRIFIPPPNAEARRKQLAALASTVRIKMSKDEARQIVAMTKGFSSSDLKAMMTEVALAPLRGLDQKTIATLKPNQLRPVSFSDFAAVLATTTPSVTESGMQEYYAWARQYGGSIPPTDGLHKPKH